MPGKPRSDRPAPPQYCNLCQCSPSDPRAKYDSSTQPEWSGHERLAKRRNFKPKTSIYFKCDRRNSDQSYCHIVIFLSLNNSFRIADHLRKSCRKIFTWQRYHYIRENFACGGVKVTTVIRQTSDNQPCNPELQTPSIFDR